MSLLPFILGYSLRLSLNVFVSLSLGTLQSLLLYIEGVSRLAGFGADFLCQCQLRFSRRKEPVLTLCFSILSSAKLLLQNLQFFRSRGEDKHYMNNEKEDMSHLYTLWEGLSARVETDVWRSYS